MKIEEKNLSSALQAEESKLLACVHCGLCLEACPTYVLTGDENDGPRGRIYLMRAVAEKRLDVTSPTFADHIDRCLGCRACESACPAGVEYGQLLEAARDDLRQHSRAANFSERALSFVLKHVWPRPKLLRLAFSAARLFRDTGAAGFLLKSKLPRRISPQFEFAFALLVSSTPAKLDAPATEMHTHEKEGRPSPERQVGTHLPQPSRAMLFTGCVTEGLFARVNRATGRVLAANSCRTTAPRAQVCCGALHAHAGDLAGARALARRNIEAFTDEQTEDVPIITNAGGCGAMLAAYAHLLSGDPDFTARASRFSARVRDVSQHLVETAATTAVGLRAGASLGRTATTYDASCHLLHGQRAAAAPLALLGAIPSLNFVPLADNERCCGGAGVYNLLQPDLSAQVLDEKLSHIRHTGALILATGNPGCHMQIGAGARLAGLSLRLCHPVELLDESYRRAGIYNGDK